VENLNNLNGGKYFTIGFCDILLARFIYILDNRISQLTQLEGFYLDEFF